MQFTRQKSLFRGSALLVMIGLIAFVAGCGSSGSSSSTSSSGGGSESSSSVKTVAIATPAKANDYGWNEQGVQGANEAAESVGAEVEEATDIGYEQTEAVLRQLAQKKPGLLIAHASGYDTSAQRIAEQYEVPTVSYDIATEKKPGVLTNITTSSQEGAYLAGILAAKSTKTGKVGVIISASDTNWYEMAGGYAAGVHSVDPKLPVLFAQISAEGYDDAAGGKRVATSMIAEGADVIFAMGDGASFGYLQAIETANVGHKVWYIGDIGNMTPIDKKKVLLSSVLWNFTKAYETFIEELDKGTFGEKGYNLTLANGGISLLKTPSIPAKVWSEIESAEKKIIAGEIEVPETTKSSQVKELLNG